MGAFRHSFEEVIAALESHDTKTKAYESLGVTKAAFYRYLRIMRDKGLLDEHYNIIYKRIDYETDERFKFTPEEMIMPDIPLEHPKEGEGYGFGGKPIVILKNSPEYEEYARKRRAMTLEELMNCPDSKYLRGEI